MIGVVQRANPNETYPLSQATHIVVAPNGNFAIAAAADDLTIAARCGNGDILNLPGCQCYPISFEQCVKGKGGARVLLAATAMAAVDDQWVGSDLVAEISASTAARSDYCLSHQSVLQGVFIAEKVQRNTQSIPTPRPAW